MTKKLIEYSKNIAPLIRDSVALKDKLKIFKETNQQVIELGEAVKEAQQALQQSIEKNIVGRALLESIKELDNEIKEAIKAAADGTDYKPADLKKYFVARCKDGVSKVVEQGETFSQLEGIINT